MEKTDTTLNELNLDNNLENDLDYQETLARQERQKSAEEIIKRILSKNSRPLKKNLRRSSKSTLDALTIKALTEVKHEEFQETPKVVVHKSKKSAIENARKLLEKLSGKPVKPETAKKPEYKTEITQEIRDVILDVPKTKTVKTQPEITEIPVQQIKPVQQVQQVQPEKPQPPQEIKQDSKTQSQRPKLDNKEDLFRRYELLKERERMKEAELLRERELRKSEQQKNQIPVKPVQQTVQPVQPVQQIQAIQNNQQNQLNKKSNKPNQPKTFQQQNKQYNQLNKHKQQFNQQIQSAQPVQQIQPKIQDNEYAYSDSDYTLDGQNGAVQHPRPQYTYSLLSSKTTNELRNLARELKIHIPEKSNRREDIIYLILKAQAESMNYRFGGGTLEILPENFGFLRPKGMLPTDHDVYLSSSQIKRFGLRNGDSIWGLIRPPREQEHYEALLRVETVNYTDPEHSRNRPQYTELTPIFPNKRLVLESSQDDLATRLIDMFAPIGLGQRALIVSPPKAGKTTLLKRIARAISVNPTDKIILIALLIDERPEEVTDISSSIEGEVIASTFDRPAEEHIRVATLALEKAKRLVEAKRNVVILLDSITRLARASNLTVPPSGKTLSGGIDPSGLYFPKRFFGAARNFEEGGSLTIIGTALTDTGSRMDDVIYEEFKGTGNMELHLSRKIAEQRIFPAIDITKSGTRREELLMPEDELKRLWVLRKRIAGIDESSALNIILEKLKQTKTNKEFLSSIKLA